MRQWKKISLNVCGRKTTPPVLFCQMSGKHEGLTWYAIRRYDRAAKMKSALDRIVLSVASGTQMDARPSVDIRQLQFGRAIAILLYSPKKSSLSPTGRSA